MEPIAVNTRTGLLRIGPYAVHPRLTFAEFTSHQEVKQEVFDEIVYVAHAYLPEFRFLGYTTTTRCDFFDEYIAGMCLQPKVELVEQEEAWVAALKDMVAWTRRVKAWLTAEFGAAHEISPPVLFDEDRWLTPNEVADLDGWTYQYPWGEFSYTFHWEIEASVHFSFDRHCQIGDWDGLRAKCCRYAGRAKNVEILQNRTLIEAAIDAIAANYEYLVVRASVTPDLRSLVFDLPHWSTEAVVTVEPDYPDKPFCIERHDARRKEYSDLEHLPDKLQVFLDTKEL